MVGTAATLFTFSALPANKKGRVSYCGWATYFLPIHRHARCLLSEDVFVTEIRGFCRKWFHLLSSPFYTFGNANLCWVSVAAQSAMILVQQVFSRICKKATSTETRKQPSYAKHISAAVFYIGQVTEMNLRPLAQRAPTYATPRYLYRLYVVFRQSQIIIAWKRAWRPDYPLYKHWKHWKRTLDRIKSYSGRLKPAIRFLHKKLKSCSVRKILDSTVPKCFILCLLFLNNHSTSPTKATKILTIK